VRERVDHLPDEIGPTALTANQAHDAAHPIEAPFVDDWGRRNSFPGL
jgi:hypothetical protein